jgi:hypothetical protein
MEEGKTVTLNEFLKSHSQLETANLIGAHSAGTVQRMEDAKREVYIVLGPGGVFLSWYEVKRTLSGNARKKGKRK